MTSESYRVIFVAHKYSDFDSAFADLTDLYEHIQTHVNNASSEANNSFIGVSDPVDKLHFGFLVSAVLQIVRGIGHFLDNTESSWEESHFYESIYWANKDAPAAEEYVLTFEKIVEVWIADDFAGRALTIATIDRMRQILWDEPFNVVWSARPEDADI